MRARKWPSVLPRKGVHRLSVDAFGGQHWGPEMAPGWGPPAGLETRFCSLARSPPGLLPRNACSAPALEVVAEPFPRVRARLLRGHYTDVRQLCAAMLAVVPAQLFRR